MNSSAVPRTKPTTAYAFELKLFKSKFLNERIGKFSLGNVPRDATSRQIDHDIHLIDFGFLWPEIKWTLIFLASRDGEMNEHR